MGFKDIVNKSFKRWFLNSENEISFTKIGIELVSIGGLIVAVPTLGIGLAVPAAVLAGAKLTIAIGTILAGTGARDAMDKNKK